ncbi:hypothetical protein [Streptomyces sp. NPDC050704]|uniref:hypothetical protein n=1 Tax=Streptomyces sp. NPDC050704 TaxID=3157219 RepID=UPI00344A9CEB
MTEALRPHGIELRHFAVLIELVDRGPTFITPQGVALFHAVHVAAEPLAERLIAELVSGEPEQLMDLLTRFAYPAGDDA